MSTTVESFPACTASVARARMMVRSSHGDLPPGAQEAVEAIVAELAANAIVHAMTPFTVRLLIGSLVRVEVSDGSPARPLLCRPSVLELGGRGLMIVAGLADRWGYDVTPDGKVVWAELDPDALVPVGS